MSVVAAGDHAQNRGLGARAKGRVPSSQPSAVVEVGRGEHNMAKTVPQSFAHLCNITTDPSHVAWVAPLRKYLVAPASPL